MGRKKKPNIQFSSVDVRTVSQKSHVLTVGAQDGRNLPNYITNVHLEEHFAKFVGEIDKLKVIRNLKTMQALGYALMTVSTQESADRIIAEMSGTKLRGKIPISIEYDTEESFEKPVKQSSRDSGPKERQKVQQGTSPFEMYIKANGTFFPDSVTAKDLKEHFAEFKSEILDAQIVIDRDGRSKGCGFITFSCEDAAKRAMAEKRTSKMKGKFALFMKIRECDGKAVTRPVHKRAVATTAPKQPSTTQPQAGKSSTEYQLSQADSETAALGQGGSLQKSTAIKHSSYATALASSKQASKQTHHGIYVGGYRQNLPAHVSLEHLRHHFASFSKDIVSVKRIKQSQRFGGFDFVITLSSQKAARTAVKDMDGTELNGKFTLIVAHGTNFQQKEASISSTLEPSPQAVEVPPPIRVEGNPKANQANEAISETNAAVPQLATEAEWPQVQTSSSAAEMCSTEDEQIVLLDPYCFQSKPSWSDVFDSEEGVLTSHYLSAMEVPLHCTVLVGTSETTFPKFIKEDHLRQHFAKFERSINEVKIIRKTRNARPSGGSITFTSIQAAHRAMEGLSGTKLVDLLPLILELDPTTVCQSDPRAKVFTERLKLNSLVHIYPDLVPLVLQKFIVHLNGYWSDSIAITLTGLPEQVQLAKEEIESILVKFTAEEIQFAHPSLLLESAKLKLLEDSISVYLQFDESLKNLYVCAFSDLYLSTALDLLQAKPFEKSLVLPSGIDLKPIESELKSREEKYSVMVSTETTSDDETAMMLCGFDWERVLAISKELEGLFKSTTMKTFTLPLECTSMQALFLKNVFFEQPTSASEALLEALPARVIKSSNNQVILIGTQRVIKEASDEIMQSPFITGLVSKTWNFKCSIKFQKQIEEHILQPMRIAYLDVTYVFDKTPSASAEDGTRLTFSIHIFSLKNDDLEKASERMKDLDPQTQCFPLPQSELIPTAVECFKATAKRHCTVIAPQYKPPAVVIHGLCSSDVAASWKEIEEHVGVNYIATKVVTLSMCHVKYLKASHASVLDEVSKTCVVELPSTQGNQPLLKENLKLPVKGSYSAVKEATERIKTLCSNCVTDSVRLSCKVEHLNVWQKRWDMLKNAHETESSTFIEYSCSPERRGSVSVTFVIYGSCKEGIEAAKQALVQVENGRTLVAIYMKLNDAQLGTLKRALEEKKLNSVTKFNVLLELDENQSNVEIQAPEPSKRELELTKNEILAFLDQHTEVSKEIQFMDSSLGHLLTSDSQTHHHAIMKAAEQHHVTVSPLKTPYYALKLKGVQCAVRKMEEVIETTRNKLSKTLGCEQLVVEANYSSVLSGEEYVRFNSQLTEELSVICTCPAPSLQSNIVRETRMKSSAGHLLTVQVCRGDIISERVDAIVNAANENLSHCGGLALAISQAGGPSIQAESTQYVRDNGKVPPGSAVCLGSGELPCRGVVHAVAPRWRGGEEGEQECLKEAISKSLLFGHYKSFGSISLPAIGTGIFQVPTAVFAEAAFTAVREFCEMFDSPTLHTVRIVLASEDKVSVVKDWFDRSIGEFTEEEDSESSPHSVEHSETEATAEVPTVQTRQLVQPQLQWFWRDGRNFQSYLPHENVKLNQQYAIDPNSECTLWVNNTHYQVQFQTKRQINMQTGYTREIKCDRQHAVSEATATAEMSYQWHCMDDSYRFVPYKPTDSYNIEVAYQRYRRSRQSVIAVRIQAEVYGFDFKALLQIDRSSRQPKCVKRTMSVPEGSKVPVKWYYKNDKQIFLPYSEETSDEIEEIFQGRTLAISIPIKNRMYAIDSQAMVAIDLLTRRRQEIKRQKMRLHHGQSKSEAETQPLAEIVINLRGPKENLDPAKERIKAKLESMLTTDSLTLPQGISEASKEMLEEVAKQHGISVSTESSEVPSSSGDDEPEMIMKLTGPKLAVVEARGVVLEQIMSLQTAEHATALAAQQASVRGVQYPAEWERDQSKTTELFQLRPGTSEWAKVAGRFDATMTGYRVTCIKRIQNKYLWQRYEDHKRLMGDKNDGRINEMDLFHGTGKNCPDKIYDSEEGFDMRHSRDGLWGHANYFAKDACYSNRYTYHRPDGDFEMFLAKVLTGDSFLSASNRTLRMPPVKQGHQAANVQLGEVRYDTVRANHSSTEVYMTYSNDKAYPAYLIQYANDQRLATSMSESRFKLSYTASAGNRVMSKHIY